MSLEALRALLIRHFKADVEAGDPSPVDAAALRAAADKAARGLGDEDAARFAQWQRAISHFAQLEDDERAIQVARGLRLCRLLAGAPPRPKKRRPASTSVLGQPTQSLPGLGPKSAEALAERGIETVGDLLYLVPRRYDDARSAVPLASVSDADLGERITISSTVDSRALVRRGKRRWLDARFVEDGKRLIVRFFGAFPSALDRYAVGTPVTLAGALSFRAGAFEMTNPDVLAIGTDEGATEARIIGRYPAVPGVPGKRLASACAAAIDRAASMVESAVPASVEQTMEMVSLSESLIKLHSPPADGGAELAMALNERTTPWQQRLAFEDMFTLAAQICRRRAMRRTGEAIQCPGRSEIVESAERALPFELTAAQARVSREIAGDLESQVPMNRLLQGDVGCGKTAVAFLAAAKAIGAGAQVALMAPTELLAEQHAASLGVLTERCGIRMALLTGSLYAAQKRSILALLGAGKIDLVVGTHALIAESVEFSRLGLAIVDEQHRFGVAQRVMLRRKGHAPHLLVMTATPIPRSLALSVYGDLDVSVIDELPPGRTPTETHVLVGDRGRVSAYKALQRRVEAGEQAYVVCPLVEPPEEDFGRSWRSAVGTHEELSAALAPISVGLVHGRLSVDARSEAMRRFRDGEDRVLVATTVIEVGVDVPAATVIVVEDADHFGLAQLHQLRGRVGRGHAPGHCALLRRGRPTDDARRRLDVMARTADGFEIAEEDLAIRGPGELLGARQAGLPTMRFGNLRDHLELLATARNHAAEIIDADPTLERPEHRALRAALERFDDYAEAYDVEGG